MSSDPVLTVSRLTRHYTAGLPGCRGRVEALRGVDMEVRSGELVGLLGPNGAGKSTLLLCAAGLLRPTTGSVTWFGEEHLSGPRPRYISYVPERAVYHGYLTVAETLTYYSALHDRSTRAGGYRVREALDFVGLAEQRDKRVAALSRGMLQRLGLAQALIGTPRLLLLDETLAGLDPVARRDIGHLLRTLAADGIAIVLSSHDMAALQRLATRVVVLVHGEVQAELDPTLLGRTRALEVVVKSPAAAADLLRRDFPSVTEGDGAIMVSLEETTPEEVLAACKANGVEVLGSRIQADDLEQRFFRLLGERAARPMSIAGGSDPKENSS